MKHSLLAVILFSYLTGSCQTITINGLVINEGGTPIQSATVIIKQTNQSTLTDADGRFTFHDSRLTDTLLVSASGYETKEEPGHERGLITITLKRSVVSLSEVVLNTGYAYIPKERATGSFENLGTTALNQQVGTGILQRLKNMTAAVAFDNVATHPAITVRGLSSINGAKDPLIVLDNFPYEGNIANINPNDIESITVLKDAAAASVWGTKAGNGVIVITTKKAKMRNPLSIEVNMNYTRSSIPGLMELQTISANDFIDVEQFLFNNGYYTAQVNNIAKPALSPVVEILLKKAAGQITPDEATAQINILGQVDVRKEMMNSVYGPAFNQQYAVSVRSGTDKSALLASAGYDRNRSELGAPYSRFSFKMENRLSVTKRLMVTTALSLTRSFTESGQNGYDYFSTGTNFYPYIKLRDAQGHPLVAIKTVRQGYKDTAGAGRLLDWNYYPAEEYKYNQTKTALQEVLARTALQYSLAKGLQLNIMYQYQSQQTGMEKHQGVQSFFVRDLINRFTQLNRTTGVISYPVPKGAILDQSNETVETHNARAQLNYAAVWKNNNSITLLAGAEIRQFHSWQDTYRLYGYNENTLSFASVDYANPYPTFITGGASFIPNVATASDKTNRFVSFFANGAYTYKGRYVMSASARRDASNLFGVSTNEKWNPLWSAGAAWIISKETFSPPVFSFLKLRFTWGLSGNVDQGKTAVTTIRYLGTAVYTNFPYAVVAQFENPELRWEKIGMMNTGLDFEVKGNKITGSIDWYRKNGMDLFGAAPVDYTVGTGSLSLIMNVASMKGNGIDLQLHTKNISKRFRWDTDWLLGYNKTRVTKYYLTNQSASNYLNNGNTVTALEGQPVYSVVSYAWAGLDTLGNPLGYMNGQPSKDYSAIQNTGTKLNDLVYSGSAIPVWSGSWINTFSWKGFSLSLNISYKLGYCFRRKSVNYTSLFTLGDGHADFSKRWKQKGDEYNTSVPSMIYPNVNNRNTFYNNAEVLVTKGDHIRLQYINLTYDFKNQVLKKFSISNMQLYAVAANLGIIWKANKQGIDPEYQNTYSAPLSIAAGCRFGF